MGWLDALADASSKAVRGYTGAEKYAESLRAPFALQGGMPSAEAERYAGQKLAAQAGRPAVLGELFNQIALADLFKGSAERARVKAAGRRGRAAGAYPEIQRAR